MSRAATAVAGPSAKPFMGGFWVLLRPHLIGLANIVRRPGKGGRTRALLVGLFSLVVWLLVFLFAVRVLQNMMTADVLGGVLARRFMGLLWIAGISLLMFSTLISSLSSFFLARDLDLIMAAPVSLESIFWARSARTLVASAWMPAAFLLPVFVAYGYVFKASAIYYLMAPLVAVPLLAGAGFLSQAASFLLVNLLPARRAREIMGLLAIIGFCLLYLAFRLMRPEDLLSPDNFVSAAAYLASLNSPTSLFNPAEWAVEALWPYLGGHPGQMSSAAWLALLWSTAAAIAVLTSYVAAFLYWPAYNKSLEGAARRRVAGPVMRLAAGFLGLMMKPERRAIVIKDLKTFFRDQTQWSQLLLLAALMAAYLYNFSILNLRLLPVGGDFLERAFALLNLGLVALVAATLALRFAFTSISSEGFSYWIIKSAPMSLRDFMWIKFWFWLPPIWVVSMALVFFGNYYLGTNKTMQISAAVVTAALVPGLCGLAVGLGARFPSFSTENLAQTPTGYGGLIYMVTSSLASISVIALTAWPSITLINIGGYHRLSASRIILNVAMILAAALICRQLLVMPMRQGLKALTEGDEERREDEENV
ncbi:hypothetical protein C4J81_03360 [Deltaproteobacteria bacterium Smac51]|nr:hypothetical protein C4J81_03360 [Deltaproteobacteria bacterium Smac51]